MLLHWPDFVAVSLCGLVINFLSYFVIQLTSSLTLKVLVRPLHTRSAPSLATVRLPFLLHLAPYPAPSHLSNPFPLPCAARL